MADARTEAQKNEQAVFGTNPARATDGKPLERGSGSRWAGMRATERTHYLVVEAQAAAEDVVNAGKALATAVDRFMAANKVVVAEAAKAKDEPVPPVPLALDPVESDEQRTARLRSEQTERDRVAEAERLRLAEIERQRVARQAREPAGS